MGANGEGWHLEQKKRKGKGRSIHRIRDLKPFPTLKNLYTFFFHNMNLEHVFFYALILTLICCFKKSVVLFVRTKQTLHW